MVAAGSSAKQAEKGIQGSVAAAVVVEAAEEHLCEHWPYNESEIW